MIGTASLHDRPNARIELASSHVATLDKCDALGQYDENTQYTYVGQPESTAYPVSEVVYHPP